MGWGLAACGEVRVGVGQCWTEESVRGGCGNSPGGDGHYGGSVYTAEQGAVGIGMGLAVSIHFFSVIVLYFDKIISSVF